MCNKYYSLYCLKNQYKEQSKAKQSKAKQSKAKQSKAKQSKAKQSKAKQSFIPQLQLLPNFWACLD
jgi:elongation factor P--beta-lysine ligase